MEVSKEDINGAVVVNVSGEVDMRSSVDLRKALVEVTAKKQPHIAVSLEKVTYIDSSGIATLIDCLKNVAQYGGKLSLIGVNEKIYPVFELAQLVNVFDISRENTL